MPLRRTIFEPEHETFRDAARRFFQAESAPHAERWREAGVVDWKRRITDRCGSWQREFQLPVQARSYQVWIQWVLP